MLGDVEIGLIYPHLRGVLRVSLFEPVTLDGGPALTSERLVLPQAWVSDPGQIRTGDEDSISMAAEEATDGFEAEPFRWREAESNPNEMLPAYLFEEMPA